MEIEFVRAKLAQHEPVRKKEEGVSQAAVAVVLRERRGTTEVLLIERALREGDPWSGHMAFPGGRIEPGDSSTRSAASRETFEEVGVALPEASYLGRVADRAGNPRIQSRLIISAHAFHLEEEQAFVLQESEVQSAFWFSLEEMHSAARWIDYEVPQMPKVRFPGILVGEPGRHVVWASRTGSWRTSSRRWGNRCPSETITGPRYAANSTPRNRARRLSPGDTFVLRGTRGSAARAEAGSA